MNLLTAKYRKSRAKKAASYIIPWVEDGERVLDFGCGDMLVAEEVVKKKKVKIQGIDVININETDLPYLQYQGDRIPFKDNSFDVTYASYVLHHTPDVEFFVKECLRVSRRRVILLEDVFTNRAEQLLVKGCDYGNMFISREMNMALNFKSVQGWMALFGTLGVKRVETVPIRPAFLKPTRHRMFVLDV